MSLSPLAAFAFLLLGATSAMAQSASPAPTPTAPAPAARPAYIQAYTFVAQMPAFPGGNEAMLSAIQKNLRYPTTAAQPGLEGRVFVEYIVLPDGSLTQLKVIKGLGPGYDEEAIRVLESLPRFTPGRQNGRAVAVTQTTPVVFKKP